MTSTHWSRDFYRKAKAEGFKFAVRQHIPNFSDFEGSLHKLKDKEEIWNLPFVKKWKENELWEGKNLPLDHPEATKELKLKPYDWADDGEQLLMAYLNDGSYWVVAYVMDLEKFEHLESYTLEARQPNPLDDKINDFFAKKTEGKAAPLKAEDLQDINIIEKFDLHHVSLNGVDKNENISLGIAGIAHFKNK